MGRRSGGKKIDFVHWTGFGASFAAQSAGTAGATLLAAQHDPETLLRTRGELIVYADGAQVSGALAHIAIGFCVVPEGTGSTVLWSPFTDSDAPFFYWTTAIVGYEEMVTDVIDVPGLTAFRETIDSKAMRKVRNSEVQVVVENTTILGACVVNIRVAGRFLSGT